MASGVYGNALKNIANGSIDLDSDTLKGMLLTSSYTPNYDTHDYRDDLGANEVSGTGYTAGGATLASKTLTVDTTGDELEFDAADLSWSTATITARYLVIYKSRGGASSADELICCFDFSSDQTSTAGTFLVTFNAEGLINISY